jgi:hypothetical protein
MLLQLALVGSNRIGFNHNRLSILMLVECETTNHPWPLSTIRIAKLTNHVGDKNLVIHSTSTTRWPVASESQGQGRSSAQPYAH